MIEDSEPPQVRIGELSRRTGVRPETIRAWERRYALVSPARTDAGYRLYSHAHEARVREMSALISQGVAPAEAARRLTAAPDPSAPGDSPEELASRLAAALLAYDEESADAVLDHALGAFSLDLFTGSVVLPAMAEIGRGWESGDISVAQEHFATHVIRGRLMGLARGWGSGLGPMALLACPPGELHDLGLIAFGLSLRRRGWRIAYLGPDTPMDTVLEAARRLRPALVVMSGTDGALLESAAGGLREVAALAPLWLGGPGAGEAAARTAGARLLEAQPTLAATQLAEGPVV